MGEQSSARRPGRPQHVAYDATPLSTGAPDVDARIGWLLVMSRLHAKQGRYADGAAFVSALGERGVTVSRSLVSRWESGELVASYEGLSGYEQVLGIPAGSLTGLAGYVRASVPQRGRPPRPRLDPEAPGFASRLDQLVDRVEDGTASALEWQRLGWHVAAVPMVHLRRGTWQTVARRAVAMVSRAIGPAHLMLHNAVGDLATQERGCELLLTSILEAIDEPDAQVLTAPFALLRRIPSPRAADVVLDMFEEPLTPPLIMQAVSMVTELVLHDRLTEEQRARLGMLVLRQWRDNPERSASRLVELIAVLPEGIRLPLTEAAARSGQDALRYAVEHGEVAAAEADQLSADVAESARRRTAGNPAHAPDRMLPRLVRELLFHRDFERRHQAALVLAASPFAAGVCDELLKLLADAVREPRVRLTAAWAVRYLARPEHRMRILRLVDVPDELVAAPITLALAHLPHDGVSDQVLRARLGTTVDNQSRAAMYALGMSGSPALTALARSRAAPLWQRRAATWWQRLGPAVRT